MTPPSGTQPAETGRSAAVVGTGVVGRSWIRVFARAMETRVWDADPLSLGAALEWVERSLAMDVADGTLTASEASDQQRRVVRASSLADAASSVAYVQESCPERLEIKRDVFTALCEATSGSTILASSTSAIDMAAIADGLPCAGRCIVAHPTNPPHVIPCVEVLPGPSTDPEVVERTTQFLAELGQTPVAMAFFVPGFVLNRLQAALLREALSLVERGVATVDAVDAVVRDGLGLRWALLGPFGVANTNAKGGVKEYFTLYRDTYQDIMEDLAPTPAFEDPFLARLAQDTDRMENGAAVKDIARWRDVLIQRMRHLKRETPHP